jgi:hypothetical protein
MLKGCSKGTSRKWFLADIHAEPQWMNKHFLPPQVDDKRKESELFTLRPIRSLGHWEKLAFECPRLADANRDPPAGMILSSLL